MSQDIPDSPNPASGFGRRVGGAGGGGAARRTAARSVGFRATGILPTPSPLRIVEAVAV